MPNEQSALVLAARHLNGSIYVRFPSVRSPVDFPYRLRRGINYLDAQPVRVLLPDIARPFQIH